MTNFVITPVSAAAGGAEREGVDSIKYGSTAQFATQNRLITTKDYESYIKKTYPSIDSIINLIEYIKIKDYNNSIKIISDLLNNGYNINYSNLIKCQNLINYPMGIHH